jgi:biopolymer transport protein ExbB/TolQ
LANDQAQIVSLTLILMILLFALAVWRRQFVELTVLFGLQLQLWSLRLVVWSGRLLIRLLRRLTQVR